jgi:iron complex transport system substrate-binding protein
MLYKGVEGIGMTRENVITGIIIDCAMQIHRDLGPGLFEAVYEQLLAKSLSDRGLVLVTQYPVTFVYAGATYTNAFRVDLFVEQMVVVELKSVESLHPVHAKQLLTYMKLMNIPVGLLINFGEELLKNGIRRVVHNYTIDNPPSPRSTP